MMYAIVNVAGKQMRLSPGEIYYTPKLDLAEGAEVIFKEILLLATPDEVTVGTPLIESAQVVGKVVGHGKDNKIIVFKKKRRKGYAKKQGHRQLHTQVKIETIQLKPL